MLESFFSSKFHMRRKRRGPIGPYIDRFAGDLQRRGYTRNTGKDILGHVGRFTIFASFNGVHDIKEVNRRLIDRFFAEDLGNEGFNHMARLSMDHLLRFLEGIGALVLPPARVDAQPNDQLLALYDAHMREVNGLVTETRASNCRYARELLAWYRSRYPKRSLRHFTRGDVLAFVTSALTKIEETSKHYTLCYTTRSFLRFLRWHGIVKENLALAVPSIRVPKLAKVPHYLEWKDVQRMLSAVDASEGEGIRDRAILLLLAVLGLRNIEIRELLPKDIDWRNGHIRIRHTKTRKERIAPLTKEVGKAVSDYLLHGRPAVGGAKQIFVRHRAPYGPFVSAAAISEIVEKYAQRVGIDSPRLGSHLLRHSLATRLVNQGVPIKHIADVLGHEGINTTAIYTKVDRSSLDTIALPFPGGGK